MQNVRTLSLVFGILALMAMASVWARETRWMLLHATVSVGANGRVTDVALLEDKLSATVKSMVLNKLKSWRFEPVLVNSVAVPALTYVNLSACAIPSGDGYDLAVTYVSNGPQLWEAMDLEFSPAIADFSNNHQSIIIKLTAMADGHAELHDVVMADVNRIVQGDVRNTIKKWVGSMRFKPEQMGGQAVATELEWPMELVRVPLGKRLPNVVVASDPACKAARSGNATPRSIDSPLKLHDAPKADDTNTPGG